MKPTNFIQHTVVHPGEILFEFYLEPLKLTVTEIADKLKIARPNMSAIINGKAGISPLMALKLSKAFDTTPQFWLNLQNSYSLNQSMKEFSEIENQIEALV